jgi:hypothetical protein
MIPYLRTASGRKFLLINPSPSDIVLQDIAHALGNLCRFTGHTQKMYTVAEHCVLVALILREQGYNTETQLLGLLHDAAEAYVGDLSSPLKHAMDTVQPGLNTGWDHEYEPAGAAAFRKIEAGVVTAILAQYGLAGHTFSSGPVKDADIIAGITEARDLMLNCGEAYVQYGLNPLVHKPYPHNIEIALLWAQWLYTHDLSKTLKPAELYTAVFTSLMRGE